MSLKSGDIERFNRKVLRREPDQCWNWQAATFTNGYGAFRLDGRTVLAHRIAYLIGKGDPGGTVVRHGCDNPLCCNPGHLELGTQRDNVHDKVRRGRLKLPPSKLTESQVRAIRADNRADLKIAESYGVSRSLIQQIRTRKVWAQVA